MSRERERLIEGQCRVDLVFSRLQLLPSFRFLSETVTMVTACTNGTTRSIIVAEVFAEMFCVLRQSVPVFLQEARGILQFDTVCVCVCVRNQRRPVEAG